MATVSEILLAVSKRDYETLRKLKLKDSKEANQVEAIIRNLGISYRDAELLKSYSFYYRTALHNNVKDPEVFRFILSVLEGMSFDMPDYVWHDASEEVLDILIRNGYRATLRQLSDENRVMYLTKVPITAEMINEVTDFILSIGDAYKREIYLEFIPEPIRETIESQCSD